MSFKHLFTPHEIRGHEIKNRIFSSAHQTILPEKGSPSDAMAAYHEAVTGKRLFREETEEETAIALFQDPFDVDPYLAYGEYLAASDQVLRAERIFRSALEFFPEDEDVRERLEAIALVASGKPEGKTRTFVAFTNAGSSGSL